MQYSDEELIDADYDDLSDADIMVLLLMDPSGKPVSKSRLQRLAYFYRQIHKS